MLSTDKIIKIFCQTDDFCKEFNLAFNNKLLTNKKKRNRKFTMSISEVITIQILFHISNYRTFKAFYNQYVKIHLKNEFPKTVSYNRFVELKSTSLMALVSFLKTSCLDKCTGISFVDSTPLRVCNNKRIRAHKTFKGMATRGKCSMGWFFGFKIHIITNDKGGIIDVMITTANTDDRTPLRHSKFIKKLFGRICGDKGYISKSLFDFLFNNGVRLVTKLKKNMKSRLLTPLEDAYLLRKRAIIETIFDQLKNINQIEHSRNRSITNYFYNIVSALIAYHYQEKKPSLKNNYHDTKQLLLFQ